MYKGIKKLASIMLLLVASLVVVFPVMAADADSSNIIKTNFFGNLKDDGSGCGVYTILNTVLDFMTMGIGILAVIGITIVGTKYLTAGGNEEQTRKAKHRMFQIIIGIAMYATLYVGVQFLLPGGHLNNNQNCTTVSDQELANIKQQEAAKKQAAKNNSSSAANSKTNSSNSSNSGANKGDATCLKNAAKVAKEAGICNEKTIAERIAKTAELLAWPLGSPTKNHKQKGGKPTPAYKKAISETIKFPKNQLQYKYTKGVSCSVFTAAVVRSTGYDKNFPYSVTGANSHAKSSKKWQKVSPSKAVRGDIFAFKNNNHILIYGGKKGSKHLWYQANLGRSSGNGDYGYAFYGESPAKKTNCNVWRATGK